MTDNTALVNACCLNRWCCEVGGKPRPTLPCGFEMVATVEGCPKAQRMADCETHSPRPGA